MDGKIITIKAMDVLFMEASDKFVTIVTFKKTYLVKSSLAHMEKGLFPEFFCRVHRSYIVGILHILMIGHGTISLGEQVVPLSSSYEKELFSRLNILNG